MKDTGNMSGKLTWIFSTFGGFHRFSINIRIEVHFCSFALGNERTLVACKSLRSALRFTRLTSDQCPVRASQDLHATSSFPNANEESVLPSLNNILTINPSDRYQEDRQRLSQDV